jgi:hypothetical protein
MSNCPETGEQEGAAGVREVWKTASAMSSNGGWPHSQPVSGPKGDIPHPKRVREHQVVELKSQECIPNSASAIRNQAALRAHSESQNLKQERPVRITDFVPSLWF